MVIQVKEYFEQKCRKKIVRNFFLLLSIVSCLIVSEQVQAALSLDATRYIYESKDESISVIINNDSDVEFGAQIWIDDINKKDTRPTFVATPSFFKIKPHGRQVVRVLNVSDHMPTDKESIYWLNLQEIPPLHKGSGLALAIRTRVKLIYRPSDIAKNRNGAESNLSVEEKRNETWLVNSTPFIFAIGTVYDNKNNVVPFSHEDQDKLTMFMPGDEVKINSNFGVKSVVALNDYGNTDTHILMNKK